ncbi:MAG: hypothetical protein JSV09_15440 [Thermoplasmata archaeon]|nr:MAG: hypothetical protein JSV09_15440 [Thermoplasmata archaeon]
MNKKIVVTLSLMFVISTGSFSLGGIMDPIYTPIYTPIDISIYNPIFTPIHTPIDMSILQPIDTFIDISLSDPLFNPIYCTFDPLIDTIDLVDPLINLNPPIYIPIDPVTIIDPPIFVDFIQYTKPSRIIEIPKINQPVDIIEIPEIYEPVDIIGLVDIPPDVPVPVHIYKYYDIPTPVETVSIVNEVYIHQEPVWIEPAKVITSLDAFQPIRIITIPPIVEPVEVIEPVEIIDVVEAVDTDAIQRVIESINAAERARLIKLADILKLLDQAAERERLLKILDSLRHIDWREIASPYVPVVRVVEWDYKIYVVDTIDVTILIEVPPIAAVPVFRNVFYVDANRGRNRNDGSSPSKALKTIQKAIDMSQDGDIINIMPGIYRESIILAGKNVTVQSARDAAILESPDQIAVSCYSDSILRNIIVRNSFIGILTANCSPNIHNVTVVGNEFGIEAYRGSSPSIMNCILWDNAQSDLYECQATYSCIERESEGEGNFNDNPMFVNSREGDYHLLSERGRYWAEHNVWVLDYVTSPCIDKGNPGSVYTQERIPNGGQINVGAFGGTYYASMSEPPDSTEP